MSTGTALRPPPPGEYAHLEPLPDPPRIRDMQQYVSIAAFDSFLRAHFAQRADVLVCGGGYLRHEAGNDAERLAPDCVVAFGVNPEAIVARNGYVISEVGKPPDFVLEVASRSTGMARLHGQAIWIRGLWGAGILAVRPHRGRYHDVALAGDRLVAGEYESIRITEESDGLKWGHSPVLGLDLCWDEGTLRFYDPVAGEYLPTAEEWQARHAAAEARAAVAEAKLRRLRARLELE